ncbi:MAG: RluA family pseudouridine synthase [Proteobacteria bacterium]|nr:RluA family pseudouridine synthase [Pseudomonadota bacterium]MDP2104690.1 RluA family pseudouridine synthase [Desulfobulbaceae bacterium]
MHLTVKYRIETNSTLADFLATKSGLSKMKLKECMSKGGVWLRRQGMKEDRCRKATTKLAPGDQVALYFDQEILNVKPLVPKLIADFTTYSVWDKPAGVLSQGTRFGDHCSLLRLTQQAFSTCRQTFPVHRLDREASGLILVAHTPKAAAALGHLWQTRQVKKEYEITVKGLFDQTDTGTITLPLDGKEANTSYRVIDCNHSHHTSRLMVTLETGRLHQIRRHFAMIGYPVIGDPTYGVGNKNTEGLVLRAVRLVFNCPFGGGCRDFHIPAPSAPE